MISQKTKYAIKALMTLGDERNISETWVNGERVWSTAPVG